VGGRNETPAARTVLARSRMREMIEHLEEAFQTVVSDKIQSSVPGRTCEPVVSGDKGAIRPGKRTLGHKRRFLNRLLTARGFCNVDAYRTPTPDTAPPMSGKCHVVILVPRPGSPVALVPEACRLHRRRGGGGQPKTFGLSQFSEKDGIVIVCDDR
jgi:hypothetical protein